MQHQLASEGLSQASKRHFLFCEKLCLRTSLDTTRRFFSWSVGVHPTTSQSIAQPIAWEEVHHVGDVFTSHTGWWNHSWHHWTQENLTSTVCPQYFWGIFSRNPCRYRILWIIKSAGQPLRTSKMPLKLPSSRRKGRCSGAFQGSGDWQWQILKSEDAKPTDKEESLNAYAVAI